MMISSKSRYAVKLMIDLAKTIDKGPQTTSTVSQRQGIPKAFLSQISLSLSRSGLIKVSRGRLGGIELSAHPQSIALWDIFESAEGSLDPVPCLRQKCKHESNCSSASAWTWIMTQMKQTLSTITLDQLAKLDGSPKWLAEAPAQKVSVGCPGASRRYEPSVLAIEQSPERPSL